MKKAQRTIYAVVRIDFDYDEERDVENIEDVAYGLAINPNYHTVAEGVQLTDVQRCGYQDEQV